MRKHPVILGFGILFLIGVVFFVIVYSWSLFKGNSALFAIRDRVGIVQIQGVIADSEAVCEQIDEFSNDDGIRAVVLRIDSPGGGVAPSQEIYQSVQELRKKKRVVASMGSVAASGGYLIATAAERIVANPGTLTGSISAVMHFADIEQILKRFGVRSTVVKSGKFKDIGSPAREMTAEERQLIQSIVDDIYDQFVVTVSKNRKIPLEATKGLADGRIFSGRQAFHLKLVDDLGGLQDAVRIAAGLAGIDGKPDMVYAVQKKTSLWKYLIENVASVVSGEIRRHTLETQGALYLAQ
jgi:protease-4